MTQTELIAEINHVESRIDYGISQYDRYKKTEPEVAEQFGIGLDDYREYLRELMRDLRGVKV